MKTNVVVAGSVAVLVLAVRERRREGDKERVRFSEILYINLL